MFEISKEFTFEASHSLIELPDGHKCKRPHGHSYRVRVTLQAERLDKYGFVLDYGELVPLRNYINNNLDHRNLNDVIPYPTSAEFLAMYLYKWCKERWKQVIKVEVSETGKTWAAYYE